MKPRSCCYGCTRRTPPHCHEWCPDYKKFQRENDEYNRLVREARDREEIYLSVVVRSAEKARKKRERKERH